MGLLELTENNCNTETHSEPSQTSKAESFAKILNDIQLLIIFAKKFQLNSEYAFEQTQKSYLPAAWFTSKPAPIFPYCNLFISLFTKASLLGKLYPLL